MTANDIMKLGDVLHELSDTSDSVLNVIRVLRGIPGKDHDDTVDTLYRVYDDILSEMERLAKGIVDNTEPEEAYWYCPNCGRHMSFAKLYSGGSNEQKTEEKEDEAPEE